MSNEDKMTINERRKYLRMVRKRYTKQTKQIGGHYSVIGGGLFNDAHGTHSTVGGGLGNSADVQSMVGGGRNNSASGN